MKHIDVNSIPRTRMSDASCDCAANAQLFLCEVLKGRAAISDNKFRWWSGEEWQVLPDEILEPLMWHALMPWYSRLSVVTSTLAVLRAIAPVLPLTVEYEELQMKRFIDSYNAVAEDVNQTAIEKGWWEDERNEGEILCLIHSEVSEALEALRHGNPPDDKVPEFSGVEAELADVIIRIMDYGRAKGYHIAEALIAKTEFNKTRPHKHGGKQF